MRKKDILYFIAVFLHLIFFGPVLTFGFREVFRSDLESIDLKKSASYLEDTINLSSSFKYEVEKLKDPARIAIDISPVDEIKSSPLSLEKNFLEFDYGQYELQNSRYQKIYGNGSSVLGLGFYQRIFARRHHNLGVFVGVKLFVKDGQSTVSHEKTKFLMYPGFMDIRYLFRIKSFIPWVAWGVDYYNYEERSEIMNTKGNAFGYHVQGGLFIEIPGARFIKLKGFAKFTHVKTRERNIDVNLGGIEYGIGIALGFNLF